MSTLPCRGTMEGWAFRLDDGVNGFSPTLLMHSFLRKARAVTFLAESASDYFPSEKGIAERQMPELLAPGCKQGAVEPLHSHSW